VQSLEQSVIDLILANNELVTRFPDFAKARKQLAEVGAAVVSSGCCGGVSVDGDKSQIIRAVLGELKRKVAGWATKDHKDLLTAIGQRSLQIVYNDGGTKTKIITL